MSVRSISGSKPRALRAESRRSAKVRSLREYEMNTLAFDAWPLCCAGASVISWARVRLDEQSRQLRQDHRHDGEGRIARLTHKSEFTFVLLGVAEPTWPNQHDHRPGGADDLFQR